MIAPVRLRLITILLVVLLAFTGCAGRSGTSTPPAPDSALSAVINAENEVENGVKAALQVVSQGHANKDSNGVPLISADLSRKIANVLKRVNAGNGSAIQITKHLASLDPAARQSVRDIYTPIIAEVQGLINTDVISIQNQATKTGVLAALSALATTLAVIQARTQ